MGRYRRVTHSCEETIDLATRVGQDLTPGMVVLLSGDYGSGKTEFVRGIVQGFLGEAAVDQVASPLSLCFMFMKQVGAEFAIMICIVLRRWILRTEQIFSKTQRKKILFVSNGQKP